ncbi:MULTISPECIES: type I-B CRISPR-associated protein Cas5b [unclassified Arcicella]|uniref:type I-B CRISPR-associated protein Cas5b n=1 Tax=unclassified Arcicella TaxID=2644986 RepID=UPI00285F80EC|nr:MULTISPECIES: type I-B CRISPR-associated protein Cas5b [unclassified Arcicella]MDR6561575.1 CRISPR-associated protein Cas5t [Arcicella sp. BE51]MDR6812355.1 CRISPR-associated protein Cas5t [Arcicella sp. BE140]MDR6823873.1 CRISPR-associated protein Cas5t [Arcicella sp. BE139]
MKFHKINISGWTASFRYPNLLSGFQPTLEVPPLSTVLGLINAAAGKFITYENEKIGYYFEYDSKAVDLETIYQMDGNGKSTSNNNAKSNVIRREFLFNPHLIIYTSNDEIAQYFKEPVYPLLLGRMNDLASVDSIVEVDLSINDDVSELKGQIVPVFPYKLSGMIQALPQYFTNTFPRKNLGTKPYSIVSCKSAVGTSNIETFRDETIGLNVFLHQLNYSYEQLIS